MATFTKIFGTAGADTFLTTGTFETYFGQGGADQFTGLTGTGFTVYIGGAGDDNFQVNNGAAIVVGALGGGFNTVTALGIGADFDSTFAGTIDGGQHLYLYDELADQELIVINWLDAAWEVDAYVGGDGTFTTAQLQTLVATAENALGDMTWEQVSEGVISTAEARALIIEYTNQAPVAVPPGVTLSGGAAADPLTGDAGNDILVGNAGNDTLDGGQGNDSLDGGADDDVLISGTGRDSLFGGDGTDTAVLDFGNINDFEVRLLSGGRLTGQFTLSEESDGVIREGVFTGAAIRMQFRSGESGYQLMASDIERVQFGNGTIDLSDIVDLSLASTGVEDLFAGGAGNNMVTGRDTDDVMAAGGGNDTVTGSGGADRAYGQGGNDSISGGAGNDSLFGNLGADTVAGGDGDDSMKAQTDDDVITGDAGNDVAFGGGNDDNISGGAGSDTLNGNSGFDTVAGGDGDDTLRGQGGRDNLNGGAGNDLLLGMQGFDTLVGGDGNDTLIGAQANDTLTGGSGVDVFVFAAGHGTNVVTDFADNGDKISLPGVSSLAGLTIVNVGSSAQISFGSGDDAVTVTLNGISANQLTASDFFFG